MTDREYIKMALEAAIAWELSLADAWHHDSDERKESLALVKAYRRIMLKRYGQSRTPMERVTDGARYITLHELRERES